MSEKEGVIKYRLNYQQSAPTTERLEELNVLRSLLFQMGMIGQDSERYGGYGFGNLSMRSEQKPESFIISGTQTGHIEKLSPEHYTLVDECDIAGNHVVARGPVAPSSEALTHAMFYQLQPSLQCVLHVHTPEQWQFGLDQGYPSTSKSVAFGTVEMAREIENLYQRKSFEQRKVLVMEGHEDGVISFGDSVDEAGMAMLQFYVDARFNNQ